MAFQNQLIFGLGAVQHCIGNVSCIIDSTTEITQPCTVDRPSRNEGEQKLLLLRLSMPRDEPETASCPGCVLFGIYEGMLQVLIPVILFIKSFAERHTCCSGIGIIRLHQRGGDIVIVRKVEAAGAEPALLNHFSAKRPYLPRFCKTFFAKALPCPEGFFDQLASPAQVNGRSTNDAVCLAIFQLVHSIFLTCCARRCPIAVRQLQALLSPILATYLIEHHAIGRCADREFSHKLRHHCPEQYLEELQ
ncbi:hypothetical protein KC351_g110 [Hortaea werneckii]|nr:hypothetical protein KC351_g110 [Hortaea werneckii]